MAWWISPSWFCEICTTAAMVIYHPPDFSPWITLCQSSPGHTLPSLLSTHLTSKEHSLWFAIGVHTISKLLNIMLQHLSSCYYCSIDNKSDSSDGGGCYRGHGGTNYSMSWHTLQNMNTYVQINSSAYICGYLILTTGAISCQEPFHQEAVWYIPYQIWYFVSFLYSFK